MPPDREIYGVTNDKGGAVRRLCLGVGVLAIAAAIFAFVGAASADAPRPWLHRVHFMDTDPTPTGVTEPVYFIDPSGNILPAASCGLSVGAKGAVQLVSNVQGWETDPDPSDPRGLRFVSLRATVRGTVMDTSGSIYQLSGTFEQFGLQRWPSSEVPFDGFGQLTLSGSGGVLRGAAEYRDVDGNPAEWDFSFTSIQYCTLR